MIDFLLTTTDNPWNPHTHYDEWKRFDESKGYFTESLLARIIQTSSELSEADQDKAYVNAVSDILEMNPDGIYTVVTP